MYDCWETNIVRHLRICHGSKRKIGLQQMVNTLGKKFDFIKEDLTNSINDVKFRKKVLNKLTHQITDEPIMKVKNKDGDDPWTFGNLKIIQKFNDFWANLFISKIQPILLGKQVDPKTMENISSSINPKIKHKRGGR